MISQLTQTKRWLAVNQNTAFWIKSFIGSALIALFAQISVPMYPVPITGQTLAISVVGLGLGRKAGTTAVLLYLLEGVMGLPVFANGGTGLTSLLGPSGGYLIGFVPSAYLLGYFSDKGILNSFTKSILVALVASAVTFAFGLAQLSFFVPADKLLQLGFYPFILGGIIKAVLAGLLVIPTYKFFSKL
ncbi:biotin transporter BioY [Phocoenobacter skyensis]|uniref:Biotin transporter n=1 Tax=Phocoenobacter skyensis TaxID=97481 RepID=A0A1H7WMM6_9PAST|nr:biotin transporter BioY [Pasteurella skyensis]MDP8078970.1 biotin transporter BioY [Pasteurella skyensis]MDP8084920.1 biotin transporter BioY [Pasteurella skyensis]MDP8169943.1 biotin transporter BioY [Pasteurella skyensis]MDP8174121.1 biotin transporter BioY [Pasteurella skyensis]MDP8185222.1 biotin transporter BioY [Pasteurella skyensis]